MSPNTTTRVQLAEAALEKFDRRIAELAETERETTRAFANDPSDANAKKVRAARTDLDDWRRGREVAAKNLEDARKEAASAETQEHAEKARELAQKASRRAFRVAIQPHVDTLVRLRDEAERAINEIANAQQEQRRAANEASHHAALAGIALEVPRLEMAEAAAHALAAMSKGEHLPVAFWFGAIAGELPLAREVFSRLGLGEPLSLADRMSYAEMIERALDGEDVYAAMRPAADKAAE